MRKIRAAVLTCAVAIVVVASLPGGAVAAPDPSIPVGARPLGVVFSPDGTQAFVANNDGNTLSVIDAATGTVVDTIPTSPKPFDVATSPDASPLRVYASTTGDNSPPSVDLVDPGAGTVTPMSGPLGNPSGVAADAAFVYATNATGQFTRFPAAGGPAQGCELSEPTRGVALVGSSAYVSLNNAGTVAVIDTSVFTCLPGVTPPTIPVGPAPWGMLYNAVRGELYVGNSGDGSVSVIDPVTNTVTETIAVGAVGSRSLAVSADGDRLYVTSSTGSLFVVNRAIPARSGTAPVSTSSEGVAASSDGRLVYVTSAGDNTVIPFVRPAVTAPVDVSVVEGSAATFSVTTTGDVTALSWETSRDGVTWTPVAGATGLTLTLNPVLADSGLLVRAVAQSVVFDWTTSAQAVLTVTAVTPTPAPSPSPTSDEPLLSATGSSAGPLAALATALVLLGVAGTLLARRRRA